MCNADGSANDAGALLQAFGNDGLEAFRKFVGRFARTGVAVIDGERQKNPAWMVNAAKRCVGQHMEALLAAIVRMRTPANVRHEAGGVAQAAFAGCFRQRGVGIKGAGPRAEFAGVFETIAATP